MRYLTEGELVALIPDVDVIALVSQAFEIYGRERRVSSRPAASFMVAEHEPPVLLPLKGAVCSGLGVAGALIGAQHGDYVFVVYDSRTGQPRGIVEQAAAIKRRTAASALVAAGLAGAASARVAAVVGAGRIGIAVAQRAAGFGMTSIVSGRPDSNAPGLPLQELLSQSDVVSIHCPLTPATEGMVNAAFLSAMKPTALLVNTARGRVVDQTALAQALHDGVIAGAAIDVTDPEPLPVDHPLLNAPNLLVLPHLGSATTRTREAMANMAVDNLLAGLAGQPLPTPVS